VSTRSCPDWPTLLEVAPDLHFKHYTLAEARLPAEVIVNIPDVPQEAVAICADLEHNVYNPTHTDPRVAAALQDTHWYPLKEWAERSPRT
jgi:L-ascorbate metabolism protein UlaG (beta-lactamase superfamily)